MICSQSCYGEGKEKKFVWQELVWDAIWRWRTERRRHYLNEEGADEVQLLLDLLVTVIIGTSTTQQQRVARAVTSNSQGVLWLFVRIYKRVSLRTCI